MAKEKEEALLALRTLRQLLITYLTSVRGGAALKALMEQLVGEGETGKWGIETVGGGAARLCVERSGEIRGAEGAEQFAVVAGGHRDERGSEGDEEGGLEGVGDGIVE